jgi:hypothetical protein
MSNFTKNKTLHWFQLLGMLLMIAALVASVAAGVLWLLSPEHGLIEGGLLLSAVLALFGFIMLACRVIFGYRGMPE